MPFLTLLNLFFNMPQVVYRGRWLWWIFSVLTAIPIPHLLLTMGISIDKFNYGYSPGLYDANGNIRWHNYPGSWFAIGITWALVVIIWESILLFVICRTGEPDR